VKLWFAQGFGVGRIPVAPGTFGSALGLGWFALLIASGRLWVVLCGTFAGFALSVWFCGAAERILGRKDPGSVVLDEITAMPVCFFAWIGIWIVHAGRLPGVSDFFVSRQWPITAGIFILCRIFDVLKPWPVRQSQALPGGWGITVDDFLAATYVNIVILLACLAGLQLNPSFR
jgi:phosphatidylglycerophosphatase A